MVPVSSIVILAVDALIGISLPLCLSYYLVRKFSARTSPILIGAGTFILFALVLEAIVHQLVLNGPHGEAIIGNTFGTPFMAAWLPAYLKRQADSFL